MEGGADGDSSEEWESSDDYSSDDDGGDVDELGKEVPSSGRATDGSESGATGGTGDGKTMAMAAMATMAPGTGDNEEERLEATQTKEERLSDGLLDDLLDQMDDGELDDLLNEEEQLQANRAKAALESSTADANAVDGLVAELDGMAEVEKEEMDGAATKVQAVFKGRKARDEVEELKVEKEEMDGAATKVQAVFKGRKARDEVDEKRVEREEQSAAAIKMQTSFRRSEAKSVLEARRQAKEEMDDAAVKLQASMRRREAQAVAARLKLERDTQQEDEGGAEHRHRRAAQVQKERQLKAHDGTIG